MALHARLAQLDPVAAARMEPGNRRRVVRALEVVIGSGQAFSDFGPGLTAHPPSDVVQIGLRWPRPVLSRRIEERFASMLDAGLLAEVKALAERPGGLSRTAPPRRSATGSCWSTWPGSARWTKRPSWPSPAPVSSPSGSSDGSSETRAYAGWRWKTTPTTRLSSWCRHCAHDHAGTDQAPRPRQRLPGGLRGRGPRPISRGTTWPAPCAIGVMVSVRTACSSPRPSNGTSARTPPWSPCGSTTRTGARRR